MVIRITVSAGALNTILFRRIIIAEIPPPAIAPRRSNGPWRSWQIDSEIKCDPGDLIAGRAAYRSYSA